MNFVETTLAGVYVIDPDPKSDERGSFMRTFDAALFGAFGLVHRFDQQSAATNALAGTIRGLHFQLEPHEEAKLVRCTRGSLYDVAVDLRPASPTYGSWFGIQLDAESGRALYIPKGFAHGYQTLCDDTDALYLIDEAYRSEAARGIRYDDPALAISWPQKVTALSERDGAWPAVADRAT